MNRFDLMAATIFATALSASSQSPPNVDVVNSADGIRVAYEIHGEGQPALVFVHGWLCNRSYWNGQLEPLSSQFKVVAIDLAGHGESGLTREAWTMEAFGSDVAAVVETLGLQRVILIGHSMGGDVIAEAARKLKGRVVGLIMVDAYKKLGPGRSPYEVQSLLMRVRCHFPESVRELVRTMFLPNSDPVLVKRVVSDMSSAPPGIALGAMENALNYSREMPQTLKELNLPVIAINSDNSPTDVASMKLCGVEVMIMPGAGHFLMMEDPKRFNRILSIAIAKLLR